MKRETSLSGSALLAALLLCIICASTTSAQWDIEVIDSLDDELYCIDLALDGTGGPHIIYSGDDYESYPTYARRSPIGWHTETIENVKTQASCTIAVDQDGYPHVGYVNFGNFEGPYARYGYYDGTDWHFESLLDAGLFVSNASITLDDLGHPSIAIGGSFRTVLAERGSQSWSFELVDWDGSEAWLALDGTGAPHICIHFLGRILYAYRDGAGWHVESVAVRDESNDPSDPCIAVESGGDVHMAWYSFIPGFDLKYGYRSNVGWQIETVDSEGVVGGCPSLAVDANGHPHISYYDVTNGALKYAWHDGAQWNIEVVDPVGRSGSRSSIALDDQGCPHIAYYDGAYEMVLYATRSDEIYPIDYVVAHWIDDDLDPDDPCQISLAQVLQGITWWAVDAVVPYTDGLTIDLLGILDLIAKWSDDVCIEPANGSQSIPLGKLLASSGASGSIEAVREMSVEGDRLAVSVTVRAKERIHGLALEEDLPEGWLLVPIDNAGATFKASTLEWLWLTVDAGETLTVRYELIPPGGESATEPGAVIGTIRAADPAFEKAVGSGKVPTGMPVSDKPLGVVAYPNPVRDVHTVTFEVRGAHAAEVERMRVEIYDLAGHLVYRSEDQTTSLPWHTENLTGEYLANGVYVYQASLFIDGEWRAEDVGKLTVLR